MRGHAYWHSGIGDWERVAKDSFFCSAMVILDWAAIWIHFIFWEERIGSAGRLRTGCRHAEVRSTVDKARVAEGGGVGEGEDGNLKIFLCRHLY